MEKAYWEKQVVDTAVVRHRPLTHTHCKNLIKRPALMRGEREKGGKRKERKKEDTAGGVMGERDGDEWRRREGIRN